MDEPVAMDITGDYGDRLKPVFDLCDSEKQGYISVQHFVSLAKEHFGADEDGEESLTGIVKLLDPEGDGKIHFGEFLQGVKQILELKSPSSPQNGPTNGHLFNLGSEETLVGHEEDSNSCGTHENSELNTFNEYDMMTDDDQVPSNGQTSNYGSPPDNLSIPRAMMMNSEDDRDSAFSGRSSETQEQRCDQEVTDEEEKFEDYGAAEDESETDSPAHKKRDKNTLHVHPGASRSASSRAFASQLYRSGSSATASRRSSCSDEIFDDIDGSFLELNDKVKRLEAQINQLQESQVKGDERTIRLKEENTMLVERVHILEESLREVEMKAQERLKEEQRQHREMLTRTDKEKTAEIEILSSSLHHIEREYQTLKEEAPRLRAENDRLRKEKESLEERVTSLNRQLSNLTEEHEASQARIHHERGDMEQERKVNAQLLDELSRELEELRSFRLEAERGRSRSSSLDLPRTLRKELESKVQQLHQDNNRLRVENEELQAHLLSNHVQEGRLLLQNGAASLADEIENLPKDELMRALKEQQEVNSKLREYVDRMTLRILEKNPSLLEVPITVKK